MENERLKKQLEFCREIDKEKFIGRQTYKSDAQTKENDAACMAYGCHDSSFK